MKTKKPDLTPRAKKKYLKAPYACPFCGSRDIEGKQAEIDCGACWQSIFCVACKRRWDDVYKLTNIDVTDLEDA
jgi:transcription elongation factor Elf1